MDKRKLHNSHAVPTVEDFKNNRFAFITNEVLKENVAIKMQYIVFLLSLSEEYTLPGTVTYSAYKTIVVFTASIVESLIHYKLHELIESGSVRVENIMEKEVKYLNKKELYKISDTEKICGIKEVEKAKKLSDETVFHDLNKAAKKSGLFDKELFYKSEEIRKARNKIHLYGLKEIDDKYSKKDINDLFAMASAIIKKIEENN